VLTRPLTERLIGEGVGRLRDILLQYSGEAIAAMQREGACAFPYMLWSSIYGAWGAESGHRDAFEALLGTLARRATGRPYVERSVCPEGGAEGGAGAAGSEGAEQGARCSPSRPRSGERRGVSVTRVKRLPTQCVVCLSHE
jgi:hypothetical protein